MSRPRLSQVGERMLRALARHPLGLTWSALEFQARQTRQHQALRALEVLRFADWVRGTGPSLNTCPTGPGWEWFITGAGHAKLARVDRHRHRRRVRCEQAELERAFGPVLVDPESAAGRRARGVTP